jgi:hypothetical protein
VSPKHLSTAPAIVTAVHPPADQSPAAAAEPMAPPMKLPVTKAVLDLTLNYNALELPADTGQTMIVYTAEPGSPSGEALKLLASSTPTPDQVTAALDHG